MNHAIFPMTSGPAAEYGRGLYMEEFAVSSRNVCIHNIDDPAMRDLSGFRVIANSRNRGELRTVMSAENVGILIVDLDQEDALDAIVEAHEINPTVAIIGIIGQNNIQTIVQAQRAGCRQITCKPLDPNDLIMAMRKAVNEATEGQEQGKTISIIASSGGAGSTTIACYLGLALAEQTKLDTAIIDLDFEFGSVAKSWDIRGRYSIADLAAAGAVDRLLMEDAFVDVPGGVGILPRPEKMEQAHTITEAAVNSIMETAKTIYPNIVIDLPRKLDAITGAAIQASDKLIIVLELTVGGIYNAARLSESLLHFGFELEMLEFVVNRYSKNVHNLSIEEVQDRIGKKVLAVVPNHYKSLLDANDLGQPVSDKNPVRRAIAEIATNLIGPSAEEQAPAKRWMSGLKFGRK